MSLNVGELIEILNKLPAEKEVVCIFEACDFRFSKEDVIEKKNTVFINADQTPIDWLKVE